MEKNKNVEDVISKIEKTFGKGTIQNLADKPKHHYDVISTGSLGLDLALGIGGLPFGRIVEIYGPESSGKSTLTLHLIAEGQKLGHKAAIIDSEHAFDASYAENLGVDLSQLYLVQPDNAEQGLEIADMLAGSGGFKIIVIDSVAAMVPKSELDGEMGDSKMGIMARLMSQALRKLTGTVSKQEVLMVFINQIREKIGVMFGNPETTTGGNALKFYASIRMDIRKSTQIKDGDQVTGVTTKVKVLKNKCAPPFKLAEFIINFGTGIDRMRELLDFAVSQDVIKKSGSWFSYGDTKLGQGFDNVRTLLEDNPELMAEVEEKVMTLFKGGTIKAEETAPEV